MNVRKNKLILIDPYQTKPKIIQQFFTKVPGRVPDTYRAKQDVTILTHGPSCTHVAICGAKAGLNKEREVYMDLEIPKVKCPDDYAELVSNIIKNQKRILWVSRHNMHLDAYKTICNQFGQFNVVIPYSNRVLNATEVLNNMKKHRCTILIAILPDRIWEELDELTINTECSFFKYVSSTERTGANYSPKRSFKVHSECEVYFKYFENIKTGEKIDVNSNIVENEFLDAGFGVDLLGKDLSNVDPFVK